MTDTSHQNTLSLKSVKKHFDLWRSQRLGKGRIPKQLWKEAVSLLEHYPISKICKALSLNPSCLKHHAQELSSIDTSAFVEVLPTSSNTHCEISSNANCEVTLMNHHGNQMVIKAQSLDFSSMIKSFLEVGYVAN